MDGQQVNAVSARDLHGFLEVGRDFTNWIKDRIDTYDFREHQDYEVFANSGEKSMGRPAREYMISLDMAKELAMVERNVQRKPPARDAGALSIHDPAGTWVLEVWGEAGGLSMVSKEIITDNV